MDSYSEFIYSEKTKCKTVPTRCDFLSGDSPSSRWVRRFLERKKNLHSSFQNIYKSLSPKCSLQNSPQICWTQRGQRVNFLHSEKHDKFNSLNFEQVQFFAWGRVPMAIVNQRSSVDWSSATLLKWPLMASRSRQVWIISRCVAQEQELLQGPYAAQRQEHMHTNIYTHTGGKERARGGRKNKRRNDRLAKQGKTTAV